MHEIIGFSSICLVKIPFSGRAWGKGKKKKKQNNKETKKQTSWQQTVIVNLKPVPSNIYHKAATTWTIQAAADETRRLQSCIHSVQETQQYKWNCSRIQSITRKLIRTQKHFKLQAPTEKNTPTPSHKYINLQKQEMNELKCKTIC